MDRSLSYILPVKNAQSQLDLQVESLLEMLSELTPAFELLIVDEGSDDDTPEIARELAQRYPQVSVTPSSGDEMYDLLLTMDMLSGEIVLLAERNAQPESSELRELWQMRGDDSLIMARLPRGPENLSDDLITRLMSWGEALRDAGESPPANNVRLIRRSAMQRLRRESPEMAY